MRRRLSLRKRHVIFTVGVVLASTFSIIAVWVPADAQHLHTASIVTAAATNIGWLWE